MKIKANASLISAGTEGMFVVFGRLPQRTSFHGNRRLILDFFPVQSAVPIRKPTLNILFIFPIPQNPGDDRKSAYSGDRSTTTDDTDARG